MIEFGVIGFSVVLVITVGIVLAYLGYFEHVEVTTGNPPLNFDGLTLAYKAHKDTFSGIGFYFTKQFNLTAVQPSELKESFSKAYAVGIYYDEPDLKKKDAVYRFVVGLLLTPEADSEAARQVLEQDGYRFTQLPSVDHVVYATFPFRSYLAVPIALRKVYPLLKSYTKEKRLCAYPSIEFYTPGAIQFVLPLSKQQDFYYYYESEETKAAEAAAKALENVDVDRLLNDDEDDDDDNEYVEEEAGEDNDKVDELHPDKSKQSPKVKGDQASPSTSGQKARKRQIKISRNNSSSSASSFDELNLESECQPQSSS